MDLVANREQGARRPDLFGLLFGRGQSRQGFVPRTLHPAQFGSQLTRSRWLTGHSCAPHFGPQTVDVTLEFF